MDVNYLLKDELIFELSCRGVYDVETVAPMRKILREIIKRESSGVCSIEFKVPKSCIDNPLSEISTCESKFKSLSAALSEITDGTDDSNFSRIFTRLAHLLGRIKLVIPTEQGHIEKQLSILNKIQEAIASMKTLENVDKDDDESISERDKEILHKSLGREASSIIDNIEQEKTSDAKSSNKPFVGLGTAPVLEAELGNRCGQAEAFQPPLFKDGDLRRSQLQRTSTLDVDAMKRKLVPIKDWGVKFNGKGTLSINAFLERVMELKEARNATEIDLFRYAIDLFEDDALIWFRANRDRVSCWDELLQLLISSFQSPFYEEELLDEIKRRTQSKHENVLIYVSVMQNMFNRLPTRLSEQQKLAILLRNIQPDLQRAVCRDHFNAVAELVEVLRVIERTNVNCENFQEPSQGRSVVEPDLAFRSKEINAMSRNPNVQGIRMTPAMRCWNCRNTGHVFRECPAEKQRLFCYKCGKFGSTVKKCPCSNSGNANSEGKPAEVLPK
jgi:hypothetical protein